MARIIKKGPFADAHLLKKVDALNAAGKHEARGGRIGVVHAQVRLPQRQ